MECKLTHVAPPFRLNGGSGQMVNVTDGCCAATITTRYEAIGPTNILTLAHYPMTRDKEWHLRKGCLTQCIGTFLTTDNLIAICYE